VLRGCLWRDDKDEILVVEQVTVGQMVSLGGYPSDWLLVDRVHGSRLCLRRAFGEPARFSAGFWVDARLVHEVRWPKPSAQSDRLGSSSKTGAEGQS
jgi:hypothetical protein